MNISESQIDNLVNFWMAMQKKVDTISMLMYLRERNSWMHRHIRKNIRSLPSEYPLCSKL